MLCAGPPLLPWLGRGSRVARATDARGGRYSCAKTPPRTPMENHTRELVFTVLDVLVLLVCAGVCCCRWRWCARLAVWCVAARRCVWPRAVGRLARLRASRPIRLVLCRMDLKNQQHYKAQNFQDRLCMGLSTYAENFGRVRSVSKSRVFRFSCFSVFCVCGRA